MTLDARAMVLLARRGPGHELIVDALAKDDVPRVCATALAETAILLHASGDPSAEFTVQALVDRLNFTVVPFTQSDWKAAARAYQEAIKTAGSRPTLGGCLTAAVAVNTSSPLAHGLRTLG
jgi:uncharacterized protein with PIN domain